MPFILITGYPSSGKTHVCDKLESYFTDRGMNVTKISENEVLRNNSWTREIYNDSNVEKRLRQIMKADYNRIVNSNEVLILDGLNYIKGFRYELYCSSKLHKSTQCVIHCDISQENAWKWNVSRPESDQYSKTVFDSLVNRYEPPNGNNRWDAPLVTLTDMDNIPYDAIHSHLFDRKPPPPNLSTQCPPMSDTNFLHDVDKIVHGIAITIDRRNKEGASDVTIDGATEKIQMPEDRSTFFLPNLMRLKRQFIVYIKSRSDIKITAVPQLFVQYLNKNV